MNCQCHNETSPAFAQTILLLYYIIISFYLVPNPSSTYARLLATVHLLLLSLIIQPLPFPTTHCTSNYRSTGNSRKYYYENVRPQYLLRYSILSSSVILEPFQSVHEIMVSFPQIRVTETSLFVASQSCGISARI